MVDCSNTDISVLCPWTRHFICITSVDSAVKCVPGRDNLVKGVLCYELFGGIALKNHAFFSSFNFLTITFSLFTSQIIPFGQLCNSVSASSAFSLIAFETAFFALFFRLLYLLLFYSVLFWHIALFASFFPKTASVTSSFHHHVSPSLLLSVFLPHTSSYALKIPSLKFPHKFGAPTSTNFIIFS